MRHGAANWVTLHLFDDGGVDVAVHGDFKNGVCASGTRQCEAQIATIDNHRNRSHALTVNHGGDLFFATEAT